LLSGSREARFQRYAPRRERDGILVAAGLIKLPRDRHGSHRTPRDTSPD